MSFNGKRPAFEMSYKSNINPYTRDINISLKIQNTSHLVFNEVFPKYLTPDNHFFHLVDSSYPKNQSNHWKQLCDIKYFTIIFRKSEASVYEAIF